MIQLVVRRYAAGPREVLRKLPEPDAPIDYPEVGVYHPKIKTGISAEVGALPKKVQASKGCKGTVGLPAHAFLCIGGKQ
jgi:magnesium chelatase subunit H